MTFLNLNEDALDWTFYFQYYLNEAKDFQDIQ